MLGRFCGGRGESGGQESTAAAAVGSTVCSRQQIADGRLDVVDQVLVLLVGVVPRDHDVEDRAGVGDLDLLPALAASVALAREGQVLGERRGEAAPDAVGVEFERGADPADELGGAVDDGGARGGDDSGHLHRVPSGPLALLLVWFFF